MQEVDSRLVDRRRRTLLNWPKMTPMVRRIVRCPPTADVLFPAVSRVAQRRPVDMSARNQRLHRASIRTTCTWYAGAPAANGVTEVRPWNDLVAAGRRQAVPPSFDFCPVNVPESKNSILIYSWNLLLFVCIAIFCCLCRLTVERSLAILKVAGLNLGRYHIILLGDRGTRVWAAAQGCYLEADRPRFKPVTFRIASERSTVKRHRQQNMAIQTNKSRFQE